MTRARSLKSRIAEYLPGWLRRARRRLTGIPDYLTAEPRPMIFFKHDIVLAWSPKSACTDLMLWYFAQEGLLDEAMALNPFAHVYRGERYYLSPEYQARARALAASGGRGFTLVRVTRDPAKRLVSVFRYVLRMKFMDPFVAAKIGRDPAQGLSLLDLDRTLRAEDLGVHGRINVHCHLQDHPVWHLPFDRVITLNIDSHDMHDGLAQIETALGLRPVSAAEIARHLDKSARRYAEDVDPEGLTGPLEAHLFGRNPKALRRFPKSALQAHPQVARMAAEHYAIDQRQVASGDTAGVLFQS